jgi:SAM-dependent methyltransferase
VRVENCEEIYSEYDDFAWFYNRYWGGYTSFAPIAGVFDRLVLLRLRPRARVLDLCCGTGQFDAMLAERGFKVTGVDGSERQLEYARRNAPRCEFIHADVRSFSLAAQYDAALSIYDSLNHIMTLAELERTFENVCHALLPGGLFVFDLNMEEGLSKRWTGTNSMVESDNAFIMSFFYDTYEGTAQADITMFRQKEDDSWERSDVSLLQKAYAEDAVTGALRSGGFTDISVHYAIEELGAAMGEGRAFFLARKPS